MHCIAHIAALFENDVAVELPFTFVCRKATSTCFQVERFVIFMLWCSMQMSNCVTVPFDLSGQ